MPWRGKKDVERHNKKCAHYTPCVKLWLKTANKYYKETGDDGRAVIRANVAAKKWLQSRGKYRHYRRNSDTTYRELERQAHTDQSVIPRLEREAERLGQRQIILIRNFGPSGRKKYGIKVGGLIQVASSIGYGGDQWPIGKWGRIIKRNTSSVMVLIPGRTEEWQVPSIYAWEQIPSYVNVPKLKKKYGPLRGNFHPRRRVTYYLEDLPQKYRRNIDEDLRELERAAGLGDEIADAKYRQALIRAGRIPPDMPEGGMWVNAYVNNQARASLHVETHKELLDVDFFLRSYFSTPPMASESRTIFDIQLQQRVTLPPDTLAVVAELTPAFDFNTGTAYPRPPHREPYVGFRIVRAPEDLEEIPEEPQEIDDMERHWLSAYEVRRICGGPAEGGEWYNFFEPIATLYIDTITIGDWRADRLPPHIEAANNFLHQLYDDRAHGDINSVNGGLEISISTDEGPATRTSPYGHYE